MYLYILRLDLIYWFFLLTLYLFPAAYTTPPSPSALHSFCVLRKSCFSVVIIDVVTIVSLVIFMINLLNMFLHFLLNVVFHIHLCVCAWLWGEEVEIFLIVIIRIIVELIQYHLAWLSVYPLVAKISWLPLNGFKPTVVSAEQVLLPVSCRLALLVSVHAVACQANTQLKVPYSSAHFWQTGNPQSSQLQWIAYAHYIERPIRTYVAKSWMEK